MVRILHTSDLHIATPPDACHLAALAEVAGTRGVDLVLIVGDFFDHLRVSDETLEATARALKLLPARVVVLPGNHDPVVPGSPYARTDLGPNTHVLTTAGGETYDVPELDLSIWGRPHADFDDFRPMAGLPAPTAATWQIGLAHGHLTRGPADVGRAYPISPEEIERSERDYVALGHWDLPSDVGYGPTTAAYSGSPSRIGTCALATLSIDANGRKDVVVERVTVAPPREARGRPPA